MFLVKYLLYFIFTLNFYVLPLTFAKRVYTNIMEIDRLKEIKNNLIQFNLLLKHELQQMAS